MKIAIIGATGHAGSFILDEALSREKNGFFDEYPVTAYNGQK